MTRIIPDMLITFALKAEMTELFLRINIRETYRFTKKQCLYTAEYNGIEFLALQTGIGPNAVSLGLNRLLPAHTVSRILNVGTCGALEDDLVPGMPVVPETVASTWDSRCFYPDLSGIAAHYVQRCVSVGNSENTEEFREDLIRKYRAQIVDMEAWSTLAWSDKQKIPASIVKVVSDRAGKNSQQEAKKSMPHCSKTISEFLLNE